jgi:hypothetical protein
VAHETRKKQAKRSVGIYPYPYLRACPWVSELGSSALTQQALLSGDDEEDDDHGVIDGKNTVQEDHRATLYSFHLALARQVAAAWADSGS